MYTVLIIDDSSLMRTILKDIINKIEDFTVVCTAKDAYDAREKIKIYEPDLVTIDLNMPKMDGAVFLRNLMKLHPMPAIVISSQAARQSDIFDDGAVAFIEKSKNDESIESFANRIKESLFSLTYLFKRYTLKKPKTSINDKNNSKKNIKLIDNEVERKVHPNEVLVSSPSLIAGSKIIAIGSSTGGIEALLKVFQKLSNNLSPILICQHIPYGFSASFANRLNENSPINVSEAKNGDKLENGCAYLAPGNMHLSIIKKNNSYIIELLDTSKVSRHKPSIDILFRSVNNCAGAGAMAIMMTGMGDDGSIAMKELYNNGAYTLAQNEESCVVFGMPKVAIEKGAVKDICHLDDIAKYITEFCQNKRK